MHQKYWKRNRIVIAQKDREQDVLVKLLNHSTSNKSTKNDFHQGCNFPVVNNFFMYPGIELERIPN